MVNEIYDARDVASYVVEYSNEIGAPISNLKLQKLLYYVQAYFVVNKGKACFINDIEHWRHGPVVREVYAEYKSFFNDDIKLYKFKNIYINQNDKISINRVIESYKGYNPWQMVEKTHKEEPWVNTDGDEIISTEELREYFSQNKERILGN